MKFQPLSKIPFLGVKADFTLNVVIDNHPVSFFVHKRPHVDYFLETVSKWFDLVVFTASMEVYGKGKTLTHGYRKKEIFMLEFSTNKVEFDKKPETMTSSL